MQHNNFAQLFVNSKHRYLGFFLCLLFGLISSEVQAQFSLDAQIRPRSEFRNGYQSLKTQGDNPGAYIQQRSRLTFSGKYTDYEARISVQDVRVWGNTPQQVANAGNLTFLHEGWGKVYFNPKWSVKFGRQEISLDNQRVLGAADWAQQGRTHDAGIFQFQDSSLTVRLGGAFNQDGVSNIGTVSTLASYKSIQFLWVNEKRGPFSLSALFLNNGLQVVRYTNTARTDSVTYDNYSQTLGTNLDYKKNGLTLNVWGYYQFGTDGDSNNTTIEAYDIGVDANYNLSENFVVTGGAEFISGTSEVENGTRNRSFTPFYGTNHKFNGYMDYFFVGNHLRNVGLNNYYLKGKYSTEKYFLGLAAHAFYANNDVRDEFAQNDPNLPILERADPFLGWEFDFVFGYELKKNVSIRGGYSQLLSTQTMEFLKNEGDRNQLQNWAWLQINLNTRLFETKKS